MVTWKRIQSCFLAFLFQVLIAIDQLVNALLGGWADETLSSRSYRLTSESVFWATSRRFIDALFFFETDHCKVAYESEELRRHLPPELRPPNGTPDAATG